MTALMSLDARLRLARTIVVTPTLGSEEALRSHVIDLFSSGADIIQVRDRDASPEALLAALEIVRSVGFSANKGVAVTNDVDLGKAFGTDFIVLPAKSMDAGLVHAKLHEYAKVGKAIHDEAELESAAADREIDFGLVGPVFLPPEAPFPAPGLALVAAAAQRMPVADLAGTPWFATGGVDATTIDEVIGAGARRVSVNVDSPDDVAMVKEVGDKLRLAWVQDPTLKDFSFGVFGQGSPTSSLRSSPKPSAW